METDLALDGAMPPSDGAATPDVVTDEAIDGVDALLDAVEQALGSLDDGTYGRCHNCGTAIDEERLEATPTTRECAACSGTTPAPTPDGPDLPEVDRSVDQA